MRQRACRAWSVWLRWISNQEKVPTHLLQPQPWCRSPEVRGPPWRSWGGNDGELYHCRGRQHQLRHIRPPLRAIRGAGQGLIHQVVWREGANRAVASRPVSPPWDG